MKTIDYLRQYARHRPLFLSVLRAKECALYQPYVPVRGISLDFGCGDGFFARTTFGAQGIGTGLDVPESRIQEAEASGAYKKLQRYDGRTIPRRSSSIDVVVSNSVLEHVSDLPRALNEIFRILKPGGMFITTVMARPWEDHLAGTHVIGDAYKRYMRTKQVHVNLLSFDLWRAAFVGHGFRVEKAIGHLSPRACTLLDVLHYISLPSLWTYTLFHRWVLWPMFTGLYPLSWLASQIEPNVNPKTSGALFFVLIKPAR